MDKSYRLAVEMSLFADAARTIASTQSWSPSFSTSEGHAVAFERLSPEKTPPPPPKITGPVCFDSSSLTENPLWGRR